MIHCGWTASNYWERNARDGGEIHISWTLEQAQSSKKVSQGEWEWDVVLLVNIVRS